MQRDTIYARPQQDVGGFVFDAAVAQVFPDMLRRSVPGYEQVLTGLGLWAQRYAQPGTRIYDLGCSLGAATWAMRERLPEGDFEMVGVDNSAAMLARGRIVLDTQASTTPVDLVCDDVQNVPINNASIVVLNLTLQFITPAARPDLIKTIYNGLVPGGILLLSEKVVFDDAAHNGRMVDIHHDFKRAQGYSDLEIAQKRTSLENVLIPETIDAHLARLHGAGFQSAALWFQFFNFVSIVAVK